PLTFYLFAALEVVFGRVAWAIRLFDVVLLLVSAFMMFRLLRRVLGSEIIARWIALCLVLTVASRGWFFTAQPDGWAAALVVAGVTRGSGGTCIRVSAGWSRVSASASLPSSSPFFWCSCRFLS